MWLVDQQEVIFRFRNVDPVKFGSELFGLNHHFTLDPRNLQQDLKLNDP